MQFYSWDERLGSSCFQKSLHLAKLCGDGAGWEQGRGSSLRLGGGRGTLKSGWVRLMGEELHDRIWSFMPPPSESEEGQQAHQG